MNTSHKWTVRISISIIIVSVGLLTFGLYWFKGALEAKVEKIVETRSVIRGEAQNIENLAELSTMAAEAKSYEGKLNLLLPLQDQLLDFPRWIDGLGRIYRLSLKLSFEGTATPPAENSPGFTPFALLLGGSYSDVLNFLKALEINAERFLVKLDSIDLTRVGNTVSVSLKGAVFFK